MNLHVSVQTVSTLISTHGDKGAEDHDRHIDDQKIIHGVSIWRFLYFGIKIQLLVTKMLELE